MRLRIGLELGCRIDVERAVHKQRLDQQIKIGDQREVPLRS
jgi:hypothetical protein